MSSQSLLQASHIFNVQFHIDFVDALVKGAWPAVYVVGVLLILVILSTLFVLPPYLKLYRFPQNTPVSNFIGTKHFILGMALLFDRPARRFLSEESAAAVRAKLPKWACYYICTATALEVICQIFVVYLLVVVCLK